MIEISDFTSRNADASTLTYLSSTGASNFSVTSTTELLRVTDSSVAAGATLTADIATVLGDAFNLSLANNGPIIFAVRSDTGGYWIGLYNDVGTDDVLVASEIKVLGHFDSAIDQNDFWLTAVLDNTPPVVAAAPRYDGIRVTSNEAGSIQVGGVTVDESAINGTVTVDEQTSTLKQGTVTVTDALGAVGADGSATPLTYGVGTSNAESLTGQYVWGFGGADTLVGTTGDDYLVGGAGGDIITTGAGNDEIFLATRFDSVAPGIDVITDFDAGNGSGSVDQLDLASAGVAAHPTSGVTINTTTYASLALAEVAAQSWMDDYPTYGSVFLAQVGSDVFMFADHNHYHGYNPGDSFVVKFENQTVTNFDSSDLPGISGGTHTTSGFDGTYGNPPIFH